MSRLVRAALWPLAASVGILVLAGAVSALIVGALFALVADCAWGRRPR